jgi:peptidyl-prolyl cis-trans isomerase SurA
MWNFMKLQKLIAVAVTTCLVLSAQAAEIKVDAVAAVVNNGVVLESEVNEMVQRVKTNAARQNQTLPSDRALRTQAMERLILNSLQMQMAKRMGLQITDPQLDETIENIAREQKMTLEQLRSQVVQEEGSYEVFRERLREEITTGEVLRANVQRRIYVSPQEIDTVTKLMEQQGANNEEYNIGHILVALPSQPNAEQMKEAEVKANKIVELLRTGSDFKKIAIASSSAETALEGGDMGWLNINEMPTLFADQIRGKKKTDLIGPLRSGAGFHILTIFDIRGANVVEFEEVNARHVLIKPSIIVSEEKAKNTLANFVKDYKAGKGDFAAFAREHSEDPGSKLKGGELGWADPGKYVPAFRDTIAKMKKGEISEPFRSDFGWHIIELHDRRTVDATAEKKREQVTRLIYNRRYNEESSNFLRELRDQAFIEILAETE